VVWARQYGFRFLGISLLAVLFAIALSQAWELDPRWFVVVVTGLALVSISMCFVSVFSDFLLRIFFFALPFGSFIKWFFPARLGPQETSSVVFGGLVGIGLLDFILCGFYMSWFYRIFIARTEKLPRLQALDIWIICLIICHLVSTIGAPEPGLGFLAVEYLAKYSLLYFYLSRNVRPDHLPWLLAGFCFTICLEAALAAVQYLTGSLTGLALDKGAGGADINYTYEVPGLETRNRATGTTYDSHALGDFVGMLLPFAAILFLKPGKWKPLRLVFGVIAVLAVLTITVSFSRAAWLATAITMLVGAGAVLFVWREIEVARALLVCALLGLLTLPWTGVFFYERFERSPIETITARFDQFQVAFDIWAMHPIFGVGANNYVFFLKRYGFLWLPDVLPVHNMPMWIAAEIGVVGLFCYFGLLITAVWRLLKLFWARRDLIGQLAIAAVLAVASHVLNGMTAPISREPSVWTLFWIIMALAVALTRFHRLTPR
jgi:hypothetical protein